MYNMVVSSKTNERIAMSAYKKPLKNYCVMHKRTDYDRHNKEYQVAIIDKSGRKRRNYGSFGLRGDGMKGSMPSLVNVSNGPDERATIL